MTMQFSTAVRNNFLNYLFDNTTLNPGGGGISPWLFIRAGTVPANCAAARTGTQLASFSLSGSTAFGSASSGVIAKGAAAWTDFSADGTGTATYFYIGPPDGNSAVVQGTVGTSATDMIVDNTSFLTGQAFSVLSFAITSANA